MKLDALPSPGYIGSGIALQREAIKAISYVETMADLKGGKTEQAKTLTTFFTACIAAVAAYVDATLATFTSALISAAKPKVLVITYSEGLDQAFVPAVSAFASSPARTFSKVEVEGNTVILTATTAFVAGATTVTYTAPGAAANGLRDTSGNLVATHGPSAVTNSVV
jgi:branched-subunit amino acid ABC-type transport system permease component